MPMAFEISTRLVCWGDSLDPEYLAKELDLEPAYYDAKFKGDAQKQGDNGQKTYPAKTGRLIMYPHDKQPPRGRRDPGSQFEFMTYRLKNIEANLSAFGVERAEYQVSLYYENTLPGGDVDFEVPGTLLTEILKHNIKMRITVLP